MYSEWEVEYLDRMLVGYSLKQAEDGLLLIPRESRNTSAIKDWLTKIKPGSHFTSQLPGAASLSLKSIQASEAPE